MTVGYTAKYTKIPSGYLGQLVEWPEVVTEGKTIEACRESLRDALKEMIRAYRQHDHSREMPPHLRPNNRQRDLQAGGS